MRRKRAGAVALPILMGVLACAGPQGKMGSLRGGGRQDREAALALFAPLDLPSPNALRLGSGAPGQDYWQQETDYSIDASLNAVTGIVHGTAMVRYTNNSPDPLPFIWLHLEQNIFLEDSEARALAANSWTAADSFALTKGMRILSLTAARGGDSAPLEHAVHGTLARVECPSPIDPHGGVFDFEITWEFEVPRSGLRMGWFGEDGSDAIPDRIYAIAQWFPAVARYDDVHGWNALPYLGTGEFYTDFGEYDVRLTVPRNHLVAATGELVNPQEVLPADTLELLEQARASSETVIVRGEADSLASVRPAGEGQLTWRFKADRARSFAWASSATFLWDAAGLDGTLVQSFYPPSALPLWAESTAMLRTALAGYGERWRPYPFPTASCVNGLEGRSGGMEYPMIVFNGRCGDRYNLFALITHEFGHQWFPMLVNTDERRHAWMDEGLNTFINYYSIQAFFGEAGDWYTMEDLVDAMKRRGPTPVATAPDLAPLRELGLLSYDLPGRALILLREKVLGPERFDAAFRGYIRRWEWRSPRPADFFRTMEDAAGMDLSWFWRGWFLESGTIDQGVSSARQEGDRLTVEFENRAGMAMPLEWQIGFDDGTVELHTLPAGAWATRNRASTTVDLQGRRAVRVTVDPEQALPDINRSNNSRRVR